MMLEKFRITHSTLIEHYQFIEAHLEGIYAIFSGKKFVDALKDVERDSLSGVIREIRELERAQRITILSSEEHAFLRKLVERRNFWCHSCYYDLVFDRETGGLAKVQDVQMLIEDLKTAEQWRDRLYKKKIEFIKNQKN